jgi:hypothetical protein
MVKLDYVAVQASFRLKVQARCCPLGKVNEPPGLKNASKKYGPTAGPCWPLEGSWYRDPPQ